MINEKSSKRISILALLVAIIGLSIGFAAYSTTLKIYERPNLEPNNNTFRVRFSSVDYKTIPSVVIASTSQGANADFAIINNNNKTGQKETIAMPKITNLHAQFTKPGQSVTYSFYARNDGEYKAYLKAINFGEKTCIKTDGTVLDELVKTACSNITMKVNIDGRVYNSTNNDVIAGPINIDESVPIVVTISYEKGGNTVKTPFKVDFGDVSLLYSPVQ